MEREHAALSRRLLLSSRPLRSLLRRDLRGPKRPLASRLSFALLATATALVLAAGAIAQQPRGPQVLPVDQVRPGMRGYGLTVFRGTTPERFDVEVIDVLHNFRPDQDLILVRTPHPVLDHAKIVGGMSGSPIYLEGKLAGAYAYGWPFSREPIAGVTPIENMLAEMNRPFRPTSFPGARMLPEAQRRPRANRGRRLAGLPAHTGAETVDAFTTIRARTERLSHPNGIRPVSTPLMLAGFDPEAAALLGAELEPFGLIPVQGGGTGQANAPSGNARYVDGGAIGVQLVRGDISATAIGTVSHVGPANRVVAFGHPMMNSGETGLPTTTARVLHVFQSVARSFKIAEADQPLGALVHDVQSSIVIDTDVQPATVPVRIRLNGIPDPQRSEWNVEVAGHRVLTPVLVFGAILNAIKATSSDETDVMYRARYAVDIEGYGRVELEDQGYTGAGPANARAIAGLRLFELMDVAYGNPFVESRVERIEVDLDVRFARDVLVIEEIGIEDPVVDPGATVPVRVRMRRFGEPDLVRTIDVEIPEHAAGDDVEIIVIAGGTLRPEQPTARNLADLVRIAEDRFPATSVVVSLKMPTRGLRFRGHVARSLPRSMLDSLQRDTGTAATSRPFTTYLRRPVDVGEVVSGSDRLTVHVRETPREER